MTGGISLSGAPAGRWTLDHDGRRLEVETARTGWNRVVRLFADGEPAGEATAGGLKATLPYGESGVAVAFDVLGLVDGQAARCELLPPGPAEDKRERVAFGPAAGTRAARREALARAHPALYASRHVAAAIGKVLFPLLGVGALVRVLLGMVPRPDVKLPDADAPSIPWPDVPWPDVPWPDPDVSAPPWLTAILATAKFWAPILIAAVVAAREARRRKRTAARRDERPDQDREPRPAP